VRVLRWPQVPRRSPFGSVAGDAGRCGECHDHRAVALERRKSEPHFTPWSQVLVSALLSVNSCPGTGRRDGPCSVVLRSLLAHPLARGGGDVHETLVPVRRPNPLVPSRYLRRAITDTIRTAACAAKALNRSGPPGKHPDGPGPTEQESTPMRNPYFVGGPQRERQLPAHDQTDTAQRPTRNGRDRVALTPNRYIHQQLRHRDCAGDARHSPSPR
jgi:hypothetical protein